MTELCGSASNSVQTSFVTEVCGVLEAGASDGALRSVWRPFGGDGTVKLLKNAVSLSFLEVCGGFEL